MLLFPRGQQLVGLPVGAASAMKLQHRYERELRRLYAGLQQLRQKSFSECMVPGVQAALQEVREDDVVGHQLNLLHVLQQIQRPVNVVLVHEGLYEHRIRHDVWMSMIPALHFFVQLQRLGDAIHTHQALQEKRAHDGVHGPISTDEHCDYVVGGAKVVVDDACVKDRTEGNVIGFQVSRQHLEEALEGLAMQAALRVALDNGVVRNDVDQTFAAPSC
mmetsp:Transcript_94271/g.266208  ORF Transcript_94271/g.266208 Transcript_94271/m.266208 type:complete len:218 (-) Transcript_94271:586-1239(-)